MNGKTDGENFSADRAFQETTDHLFGSMCSFEYGENNKEYGDRNANRDNATQEEHPVRSRAVKAVSKVESIDCRYSIEEQWVRAACSTANNVRPTELM